MDTKDRQNKMARLVFNKGNLGQLKDGFCSLIDLFTDVLELPFEHGTCFAHDEIMERLERIDQTKWRPIRNMFILDPFYGYCKGNFSEDEKVSPAKVMLDFVNVFDQLSSDLKRKLENYEKIIGTLTKQKQEVETSLSKCERQLREERAFNAGDRTEMKTAQASISYLEGVVKEKNEKIAELQREKNVQLWEREKERIFSESEKRIRSLEDDLQEQRRVNSSLTRRLTQVDDSNRMLKLRQEMCKSPLSPGPGNVKSSEELKREIYLLEKDVTFLEDQLYNQQRTIATVIYGLKTDLFIISDNLTDVSKGHVIDKDFVQVCELVSLVYNALLEGDLTEAQKKLPPHYSYLPLDFKIKRVRRVSRSKTYVRDDTLDNFRSTTLPPLRGPTDRTSVKDGRNEDMLGSISESPIEENPCLVDPIDKQINTTACMRYFPHMSMEFIKDHWLRFKEFDADGNESLDFTEVVKALTSMGLQFTAQQAEEAMRESDLNKSRTLDFYEYLTVADKLFSKKGRSELFHTGAAKMNRKVIAKTCAVM
ncbi:uncharacterized protein LOC131939450 [Physella acuta]|uniref:uncharacterized protein LOC131939450 n=1 Tax=Physella acuta TaxID=109671 RepID=UPI0027DE2622|nr:uncharacterized protein LOC131939450 [Physella acuta]XP_059153727.1 uncharacterized protein LOC131939450 [Physella acuta]